MRKKKGVSQNLSEEELAVLICLIADLNNKESRK